MEKRVELLAPAGNYEAFIGALNAGADAVYLAGQKFGARAYADNFTAEEICHALHVAHFYGKKIYLTVNTLLKDGELEELPGYLRPFYEAGLDGVIVQDMGVLTLLREEFPDLELHASTQMTITGAGGAAFLKEHGVVRVVPARELSLEEICAIKEETGLEIECFIHGAMCYCYSGQCLFSSILGGRSGNRGRCAQPCRLPYSVYAKDKVLMKEGYPLSLKDMCTLSYLPKLLEAGIDSFKIEGRMKKPEYAAGVTALYRKYIDLYEKDKEAYQVEDSDLEYLKKLYIRSEIQTGYYERHNGKDMITLQKPSYLGSEEAVLNQIRERYIKEPEKRPVRMEAHLAVGERVTLQITGEETSVSVSGDIVQEAQKAALTKEDVLKQLKKMGNSCLVAQQTEIHMGDRCFLPVRALNLLRRQTVEAYENAVIRQNQLQDVRKTEMEEDCIKDKAYAKNKACIHGEVLEQVQNVMPLQADFQQETKTESAESPARDCTVETLEQLRAVTEHDCRRIYIDSDLFVHKTCDVEKIMKAHGELQWYLALPYVIRMRDNGYLNRLRTLLEQDEMLCGFLVRNLESVSYVNSLKALEKQYQLVTDAGIYCFNRQTTAFWSTYTREITLPYELNGAEGRQLVKEAKAQKITPALIVYGTIPMMITANCVQQTADFCKKTGKGKESQEEVTLRDRYQTDFRVRTNCTHCYNVIYNSVPLSFHTREKELRKIAAPIWRYDFTKETDTQVHAVLRGEFPFSEYTTGHLKRGVE